MFLLLQIVAIIYFEVIILHRMKELREAKNLSQADIARDLNISRQSYNFYENNKRDPDTATLIKIANYFEVSIDYLLGKNETTAEKHNIDISPEDLELLKQIKKASADKQKAIELILNLKEQAAAANK